MFSFSPIFVGGNWDWDNWARGTSGKRPHFHRRCRRNASRESIVRDHETCLLLRPVPVLRNRHCPEYFLPASDFFGSDWWTVFWLHKYDVEEREFEMQYVCAVKGARVPITTSVIFKLLSFMDFPALSIVGISLENFVSSCFIFWEDVAFSKSFVIK